MFFSKNGKPQKRGKINLVGRLQLSTERNKEEDNEGIVQLRILRVQVRVPLLPHEVTTGGLTCTGNCPNTTRGNFAYQEFTPPASSQIITVIQLYFKIIQLYVTAIIDKNVYGGMRR